MSTNSIPQPAATTFAVVDLVSATVEGRIRIPEFQRPLRWQWQDVQRLFDSIVKGYPIGNLLLWKRPAPEADIQLGSLRIKARHFDEGWWVVDGQQRLISLANALSEEGGGNSRFSLAYDLENGSVVGREKEESGYVIPLPILFDLQKLVRWFTKDHPEAIEKLDEASRITRVIRDYKVPAYLVDQNDEGILRDIFDRMNNYGKRLRKAEVFTALHTRGEGGGEPFSNFQQIAESIHAERGFGMIDDDTVMRAVLARRGGDVTRDIRIEFSKSTREGRDFGDESPEKAYREGGAALTRAIVFLQEEAGVPHFAFLAYRYLLVALTRFFAHFPSPRSRNQDLLTRWFWRATMTGPGPFSSSWTIAGRTLAARIKKNDEDGSVQALLESPIDNKLHLPKLTEFRTNTAPSRIVLSALWKLGPRSPLTGQVYDREQLSRAIEPDGTLAAVTPRIFSREPEKHRAWAANRMLIADEEELPGSLIDLLINRPLERSGDDNTFLASHAINTEMVFALVRGDKSDFLERRQTHIFYIVKDFLVRMAGIGFEDTLPLDSFDLDDMSEG